MAVTLDFNVNGSLDVSMYRAPLSTDNYLKTELRASPAVIWTLDGTVLQHRMDDLEAPISVDTEGNKRTSDLT